jgi:hypothetical protein
MLGLALSSRSIGWHEADLWETSSGRVQSNIIVALAGDGSMLDGLTLKYANARYIVELPAERGTHWFLLER